MKRIKVALLLPSPIIETAIVTYISQLPQNFDIERIQASNFVEKIINLNPSILIADSTILSINDIETLRLEMPERMSIIAVYYTAMPTTLINAYDETISIYDSEDVIKAILMRIISSRDDDDEQKVLSQREKDVVIGIVKGLSNKEIAQEMNVSVNTVMTHRRNIVSKLQIHSPAGLTIYAIVTKLVRLDEIKSTLPI